LKKSEIRKLVVEYTEIKKKKIQNKNHIEKLKKIEQQYFHETGRTIQSDLKKIT